MDEKEIRKFLENYTRNLNKIYMLKDKLAEFKDYSTKVTAEYGLNTGGSKGSVNSKVERLVLRIQETEQLYNALNNKKRTIMAARKVLTDEEAKIISFIIAGYGNKLSKIAYQIKRNKKYVYDTRNRAITKMCEYIGGGE